MDIAAFRTKTQEELNRMLAEQRVHLAELRFQLSIRELKNVHEIRATRRTIARILTVLNSRHPLPKADPPLAGTSHRQSERVAA